MTDISCRAGGGATGWFGMIWDVVCRCRIGGRNLEQVLPHEYIAVRSSLLGWSQFSRRNGGKGCLTGLAINGASICNMIPFYPLCPYFGPRTTGFFPLVLYCEPPPASPPESGVKITCKTGNGACFFLPRMFSLWSAGNPFRFRQTTHSCHAPPCSITFIGPGSQTRFYGRDLWRNRFRYFALLEIPTYSNDHSFQ